ncbi:uncharacterized protein EV154DRAFT_495454 [Mucor mucedo]|uniref:uncharacterized protein n=1 Tax=Mucor mucedo TaxID=29922 RepID=UPI00222004A8|nr:uncharacterized protein EV154DRAFT_495454 [Mucor mucedo]KAI7895611.1 hypothetical protein EV154DRAFT_495454 [Mucor mucedo]
MTSMNRCFLFYYCIFKMVLVCLCISMQAFIHICHFCDKRNRRVPLLLPHRRVHGKRWWYLVISSLIRLIVLVLKACKW